MLEKIGKYRIVEPVGRGGMGTVFKAHDPVLDRLVALKVISTDAEITDELRARFFREAQACARLSHPSIVTVYAMGDDDGQLFIVMELLEGEELRHLIAQRKALALEDKLSIMVQVCDGLHYAHQKGVVHRDIKPSNIFLQRSGQVKILDFGIAQMTNAEHGLTRSGLIMGSLRYISPEQVRGRVDHRSDIFSVGAVLYELLSMRPAFTGEDPMQLLEQLRTEEPPALDQLDPAIPPELAAAVARAMRKDPAERFIDLEQMRSQLEEVQRGLTEETRRVSARVRDQRDRLLQVRAALVERIGPSREDEPVPALDDRERLATIQARERDFSARIETVQARIARADSLAPALQRATELLRAGEAAEAVGALEAILAEMPEHARALDDLEQARTQAEAQRRQQLAAKLVQDARAALDEGSLTLCLAILEQAGQIPPPAGAIEEIASIREVVEAAVAAREAVRRARQEAEGARAHMEQARLAAQSQAGHQYAPALWNEAEMTSAEAATALEREAHLEARHGFELAITLYRRLEEVAREAQRREHETAEQSRLQAEQGRQRAHAEGAPLYARERWDAAEAKSAAGETAYAQKLLGRAAELFREAFDLYARAEEATREARERECRRAQEARREVAGSRDRARTADAPHYAREQWDAAEAELSEATATLADAEAAISPERYAMAADAFDRALALYQGAEKHAREEQRRRREQAEQTRQAMAERRRSAGAFDAASHAPADWQAAEASAASGEAAFAREAYGEASEAFHQSADLYHRTEELAREGVRALELARAHAEAGRNAVARERHAAQAAQAAKYASEEWQAGESTAAQASAALSRGDYAAAGALFGEAQRLFATAAHAAGIAAGVEAHRADAMVSEARRLLDSGDVAACLRRVSHVLELRPGHAGAAALRIEGEQKQREVAAMQDMTIDIRWPADSLEQTIQQQALDSHPVLDEPPTVQTVTPTEPVWAPTVLAERWPTQGRGEPTTGVAVADVRRPAPGSWGSRRVVMAAMGGLAVIGLVSLLWLPRAPSTGPPPVKQGQSGSPTVRTLPAAPKDVQPAPQPAPGESATGQPGGPSSPQREQAVDPSVLPSPRMATSPLTSRQALREAFQGRNPRHTVTATVGKEAVRIGRDNMSFSIASSRPGYVYVMIVRSNGSDVELLLPNAVEPNNHIESGQPLKLPGPQWPLKAQGPPGRNELLAIVSDKPRDFSALRPVSENLFKRFHLGGRGPAGSPPLLAGAVACAAATRCSESYGAVVFSIDAVGREPEAPRAAPRPPAATAPPGRPLREAASPRCSDILERASLGDLLTDEEQTTLTRGCR